MTIGKDTKTIVPYPTTLKCGRWEYRLIAEDKDKAIYQCDANGGKLTLGSWLFSK